MYLRRELLEEAELKRLQKAKQSSAQPPPLLGEEMIAFFKQSVQKRQGKFTLIGDCWSRLVPQSLCEHCALDSLHRGTLTILVDSSPHLYELKQLLLAGLQKQLLTLCKSAGLRKITLKPGRWYEGTDEATGKLRF